MRFIADFHIHSPYSRATSSLLSLENIAKWAVKKGISVIGTGDFTHPTWLLELQKKLKEGEYGLYELVPTISDFGNSLKPKFIISGEISCIYKKNKKLRKIHNLILLPDIESAIKLNDRLKKIGNLKADGRPILGLDAKDLLEIVLDVCSESFFIPAHIWTPWFSLFGSKSGFDSIEECFEDLKDHIYALETGLSSDPPMNRLLSCLDKYILVSNSDAHSLAKLGREANIFDTELNYRAMIDAMKSGKGFLGTIEFFPEEGKYHLDGHRKCNVCLSPDKSMALNNICPVCGNPLTIGVLHRVYELADRNEPKLRKPFYSLIPLNEIISEIMGYGPNTKKVKDTYNKLILKLGSEIDILMDIPLEEIEREEGELLAEAIKRMRLQKVIKRPGYDGKYGKIKLFNEDEKAFFLNQSLLFQTILDSERKKKEYKRDNVSIICRDNIKILSDKISFSLYKNPILDSLNSEQKEAVLYNKGHLIILAGPGSGKTLTLTHKIAYMIYAGLAKSDQILALTFTRKAAEEMASRIKTLMANLDIPSEYIWISTFHSFYIWLLREKGDLIGIKKDFSICSEEETKEIVKDISPNKRYASKLLKALPFLKSIDSIKGIYKIEPEILSLFKRYKAKLHSFNMLDMDDLENIVLKILNDFPEVAYEIAVMKPYIFVDEYQDTNLIQVNILKTIANSGKCYVCAIGDPDQAIYGFRGANRDNFFRFINDFKGAKQISLIKNYRSAPGILKAAAYLINKPPMKCSVKGRDYIILNPCSTASEEAESIVEYIEKLMGGISYFSLDSKRVLSHEGEEELSFGDIAVLYRINVIGDKIEQALKRAGIPTIRSGEIPLREVYPVNIIYRFLLYLLHRNEFYFERYKKLALKMKIPVIQNLEVNPDIKELVDNIIEIHDFDLSSESGVMAINKIKELACIYNSDLRSFIDIIALERGIDHVQLMGNRVSLMSLHSSKGLEWKIVFIIGCEDGLIPCTMFGDINIEEEKRLFYVGMTRAKELLVLSYSKKREIKKRIIHTKPSPFLKYIPNDLLIRSDKRRRFMKKEPSQLSLF